MASSSKNISMPLVFAISVGSVFAMVAITVFGMAWYSYEDRKVVNARVTDAPMHNEAYEAKYGEGEDSTQMLNLQRTGTETVQPEGEMPATRTYLPIGAAMDQIVAEHGGHIEHSHEGEDEHGHGHGHGHDHEGHDH